MNARLDAYETDPKTVKAIATLSQTIAGSGLEGSLLELVKIRASQINNCAYCVDMHSRDARRHGETEQRLYLVAVWRESSLFSARERAALAWTESLTLLAQSQAPDQDYDELTRHFSASEIVKLTAAIGMINFWNRFGVGFRMQHPVDPAL